MAYEHKEGFGNLFKNRNKGADNHPDYKGEFMLNGKLMEIAGWMKTGAKGPYMSLKVQEPRQPKNTSEPAQRDSGSVRDMKNDIPW